MNTSQTTPISSISSTEATTMDPVTVCLQKRYWAYFLASSLIVFFAGLIVILAVRLIKYCSCVRNKDQGGRDGTKQADAQLGRGARLRAQCQAIMSGQTLLGRIVVSTSCLLSVGSLLIYFVDVSKYMLQTETCIPWRTNITQQIDFAFNLFFILVFIIRIIAANDTLMFWLELPSFVDYFTIPPSFLGIFLNRQWSGLRFLRALRLMSFPDILQYLNLMKTSNSIRLAQMACMLVSVWLAGAGFVHLVETTGDPFVNFANAQEMTYWNAMYFTVVTMSTVGYGDMGCVTTIGRIFIVMFIFGALAMFASFIPEMAEILGQRQKYAGIYDKPAGVKHIVLCGHITYESVQNFLQDFLHEDRGKTNVKCVFLDSKNPDLELEALFKRNFTRVLFFKGTVMSTRDLERVRLHEADACLLLADPRCRDPDAEDAANIMRVVSVKNYFQDIRVVVQLMRFNNKMACVNLPSWQSASDQVICLAEIKLGFMAQGCLAPGFNTLLANLFVMRSYIKSSKMLPWQDSYLQGAGMEVYAGFFSPAFFGKTFPQAAETCFSKLNILLVAIAYREEKQVHVVLNPTSETTITKAMKGFFICQSEDESRRALHLCATCHAKVNVDAIRQCNCDKKVSLSGGFYNITGHVFDDVEGGFLADSKTKKTFTLENMNPPEKHSLHSTGQGLDTSSHIDTADSGHSSSSETLPVWNTSNLTSTSNFEQFDTTGYFHWCSKRDFEDCLLTTEKNHTEAENLRKHIILCIFNEKDDPGIGLCNLIMPLRASSIKKSDLKKIVIFGNEHCIRKEWTILANFPDIYVMPGSPSDRSKLRHIRVHRCHMCVVMTTADNTGDSQISDKESILCSLNIKTMNFEADASRTNLEMTDIERAKFILSSRGNTRPEYSGVGVPMLTELANDCNAQFLDQDDEDDPDTPLYMTQPFACGRAFAASVLDTLMSTAYFNSESLSLIRMLITGGATNDLELLFAEGMGFVEGLHTTDDLNKYRSRSRVALLPLARGSLHRFAGGKYEAVFLGALQQYGILCLGLYRQMEPDNISPISNKYIITNPPRDTDVYPSDQVYCLVPFENEGISKPQNLGVSTVVFDTRI